MQQWEYLTLAWESKGDWGPQRAKYFTVNGHPGPWKTGFLEGGSVADALVSLGREGWELVASDGGPGVWKALFFKRPLASSAGACPTPREATEGTSAKGQARQETAHRRPRVPDVPFDGTMVCATCGREAGKQWSKCPDCGTEAKIARSLWRPPQPPDAS